MTVKFPAIMPYPEAVRLVDETDVRVDCPETLRVEPIWAKPVVERLVEETEVNDDCPEMFNVAPWR